MNQFLTKDLLIEKLITIRASGYIKNKRKGNAGGVGNTIEDLLGIKENNLPLPNASEWELKTQKANTTSLTTLAHIEPSPRAFCFVPKILLPFYGWKHELAGYKHPESEKSFRQTIHAISRTDRGFGLIVNNIEKKIEISFNKEFVSQRHEDWLRNIEKNIGLNELNPQPYWGFDDLFHKLGSKLHNCFYIIADSKIIKREEYYSYNTIYILKNFSLDRFINAVEKGNVYIDFDARTGHNHGTKFRIKKETLPDLYKEVIKI